MKNLEEIFDIRDTAYAKQTNKIFDAIITTLSCVNIFLNDIDPIFDAGNIIWEEVNLIDGGIIIIGMIDYKEGTKITVDGNIIEITKNNIEYFRRVVHMTLPLDLVYTNDEDIIMEFLYNSHNESNINSFSEPLELENNNIEFDLTKLTEKQRVALVLYDTAYKN